MVSDQQLVELLNGSPLSDQELADALKVSRPTVARWRAGTNLPHQALRPHLVEFFGKAGATIHAVGCPCGFCKAGFTRA